MTVSKLFAAAALAATGIGATAATTADAQPGWHAWRYRYGPRPGWVGPVWYGRPGPHYGYYGWRGGYYRNCGWRWGPYGHRRVWRCY